MEPFHSIVHQAVEGLAKAVKQMIHCGCRQQCARPIIVLKAPKSLLCGQPSFRLQMESVSLLLYAVGKDPSSFAKYANNPKVMSVLDKLKGMGMAG